MTDRAIRLLERGVAAAPGDGPARLELAHALGRAGRRREAISRLDLASMPDESFDEGKRLGDELWRLELERLTRVQLVRVPLDHSVVVEPSGRLAAWEDRDGLKIVSLESGRLLHEQGGSFVNVVGSPGRIFVQDGREIARFTLQGGALERVTGRAAAGLDLSDASPAGDRPRGGVLVPGPRAGRRPPSSVVALGP